MALKEKVAHSFRWNTANVVVISAVQILRMSVLARILDVADFGLMAIALMVISFVEIFSELGFTVPLISRQNITHGEYASVFWFNLLVSLCIYALLFVAAPFVTRFYGEPALTAIIRLVGLSIIVNAFGKVFQTIKTKELCFKFIAIVSIITALFGFFVVMVLALWGFGVYSLVWGTLVQITARQAVYFLSGLRESRISFHFCWAEVASFVRVGSYEVGAQILDFVASKIDIILLGKFVGMSDLGVYNLAKELVLKLVSFSLSISRTVMTPALARIQHDRLRVRSIFQGYFRLFALCIVPVFMAFCIFSPEVCRLMYGEKWELVNPVLQCLAVYGVFRVLLIPNNTLQLAYGRTDLSLLWTLVISVVGFVLTLAAGQWGFMAIVYSQILYGVLLFLLSKVIILNPIIRFTFPQYLRFSARPLLLCAALAVGLSFLRSLLPAGVVWVGVLLVLYGVLYGLGIRRSVVTLKQNIG